MNNRVIFIGIKDDNGVNVRVNLSDVVAYHHFNTRKKENNVDVIKFNARLHLRDKGTVTLRYNTEEKAKGLVAAIDKVLKEDNMIFFYE